MQLKKNVTLLVIITVGYIYFMFDGYGRGYGFKEDITVEIAQNQIQSLKSKPRNTTKNLQRAKIIQDGVNTTPETLLVTNTTSLHRTEIQAENSSFSARQQLIEKFIKQYDVHWDTQLSGNPWQLADNWVSARQLYPDRVPELGGVLRELSVAPIIHAKYGAQGTQLKLTLTLQSGRKAIFKPMRHTRDHVVPGPVNGGHDRHNAEVAAFHLQRLLGFNRAPIVVGRKVDLAKEILPVADKTMTDTFFNKENETCFYGQCVYCNKDNGVCSTNGTLEGVLVLWLPRDVQLLPRIHPWLPRYSHQPKPLWQYTDRYCKYRQHTSPYNHGPRLLDLIDTAIFDYLIENGDRHHYETMSKYEDSVVVLLDAGKSFGNPYKEEHNLLAPLYQCCQIRYKTFYRLYELQDGVLSAVLRHILSRDPIAPVLHTAHYTALDRRLNTVIKEVNKCIHKNEHKHVVIDDKYT